MEEAQVKQVEKEQEQEHEEEEKERGSRKEE